MIGLIPKVFAFWENDLLGFTSTHASSVSNPKSDFVELQRAIELDAEWHRGVTTSTPAIVLDMSGDLCSGGRVVPVSPGSNSIAKSTTAKGKYNHVLPQKYQGTPRPCYQCGLVVEDQVQHVLNNCDKFKEQGRYTWRRNCILHYLDTLLDHNKFRIFCDLADRRTSSGSTVPNEIVPPTFTLEYNKDLLYAPTLVAVGREIDEIYLFDISLHHESDIELARNAKMEIYGPLLEAIKRQKTSSLVNLYTLEIGASLGQMSETTKFSIWQFFRLTTKSTNMENIVTNIAMLAKLSSFKLFKLRYETRWDRRMKYLEPYEKNSLWSSTTETFMSRRKGYRRRGCIRGYLVPLIKLFAACTVVGFGLSLFYVCCLTLNWIWSQLTLKIIAFIFLVLIGLSLQLFRP